MEVRSLFGKNIKVHFAGCDNEFGSHVALQMVGVKYRLYTCYPFIKNKKLEDSFKLKPTAPLLDGNIKFKHTIQDSGLFTLMFGAAKHKKLTYDDLVYWQDKLMKFTMENNLNSTCVEVDCQKVLSPEDAWKLRYRMREKLPNRQINVFHKEDGQKGLDRLIEFADYIAISVPELRITNPTTFREDTHRLAWYIKNKKPEIDIHLLGCTDLKMLKQNKFCTSADSTSWLAPLQYGINRTTKGQSRHIQQHNREFLHKYMEQAKLFGVPDKQIEQVGHCAISALLNKLDYQSVAGSQD